MIQRPLFHFNDASKPSWQLQEVVWCSQNALKLWDSLELHLKTDTNNIKCPRGAAAVLFHCTVLYFIRCQCVPSSALRGSEWLCLCTAPNAFDLLSLMETCLLDLLKAEITCSLFAEHVPQNRGCSSATNKTHSLQEFLPSAWPKPFHRVNLLCVMNTDK